MSHLDFTPLIGRQFDFVGQHLSLRLASVDTGRPYSMAGTLHTPFTLIFHGPAGDLLPEGMLRASVAGGALFDVYIMPIHTLAPGRQDYQVVFN
jgi:hypothetical protein